MIYLPGSPFTRRAFGLMSTRTAPGWAFRADFGAPTMQPTTDTLRCAAPPSGSVRISVPPSHVSGAVSAAAAGLSDLMGSLASYYNQATASQRRAGGS